MLFLKKYEKRRIVARVEWGKTEERSIIMKREKKKR